MEETASTVNLDEEARRRLYLDTKKILDEEARKEKIGELGLVKKRTVLRYVGTNPSSTYSDPHSELCRCARPDPRAVTNFYLPIDSSVYVRRSEADQQWNSSQYVAVSDEEGAKVPVVDDAVIVIDHLAKVDHMQTREAAAAGDIQRTREMADSLNRQIVELEEEKRKAAANVAAAKETLEEYLSQMRPDVAEATLTLARRLAEHRGSMLREHAPYGNHKPLRLGTFKLSPRKSE